MGQQRRVPILSVFLVNCLAPVAATCRGIKNGLDEKIKSEILTDTLSSVKEDLADLCAVESGCLRPKK